MNAVDIIIIILILLGFIIGWNRGILPQAVSLIGFVLIVVLSFMFKNPVAKFLYERLPFFKFGGVLKGVTIINILLYEVAAFILLLVVFYIIFKIILIVSRLFEKALDEVKILEIPSRIIGGILGVLENYVLVFILLYIVALPFFDIDSLKASKLRNTIAYHTPVLTSYAEKTIETGEELWSLTDKYKTGTSANEFNLEALDLFLKHGITSVESIDRLVELNKLEINDIESVLIKYRKE